VYYTPVKKMSHGGKEYLTKQKYDELKNELDFLSTTRRKEIADQLEFAKSLGDLSENAEYHEAREQQALIEDRIGKIEYILKNAEIVSHKESDVIEVGSTVVIRKDKDKEDREFTIVGSEEVDMSKGKLSYMSPIGQAMIGKKKGDEFVFKNPAGVQIKYKIISVK
jgi:transcription elongation factor GreA